MRARTWNEINDCMKKFYTARRILDVMKALPTFPAQGAVQTYEWEEINQALIKANVPARYILKMLAYFAKQDR